MTSWAPVARLMRTMPGSAASCSLQVISQLGSVSLGHKALWSRLGAATPWLTTRTLRLLATVANRSGCAAASAALSDAVEELASGPLTPNRELGAVAQLVLDEAAKVGERTGGTGGQRGRHEHGHDHGEALASAHRA
jgi:hypothetical protein